MSPAKIYAPCAVAGCELDYYSSGYCKMHYNRVQKGHPPGPVHRLKARWGDGNQRPDGYIKVNDAGHPLAALDGRVYVHRRVLYDLIGDGEHACHYCGRLVRWDGRGETRLVVDHLDFETSNNDPANLAVTCHPCNSGRTRRWQAA